MFEIIFYEDRKGYSQVREYIRNLKNSDSKDSHIKYKRWRTNLFRLENDGTRAGERFVKHLDGEIWELRPGDDRVLFAAWVNNKFVLLHQFLKTTQKTPLQEIEQAKRELADWKERN